MLNTCVLKQCPPTLSFQDGSTSKNDNILEMEKCHFFSLQIILNIYFMNKCAEDLKVIGYSLTVNRRERCSRYMMGRIYGRLNVIFKFAKSNRAKTVKSQN